MKRLALGLAGLAAGAFLMLGGAATEVAVTATPADAITDTPADAAVENIIW